MSWQEYVDEHLMCDLGSGERLQSAAILGHDGGVWAESPEFPQLSETELIKVMDTLSGKGTGSLLLGGQKYMVIGTEPGDVGASVRGKKGQGGLTIKKTNSALVVGIYGEGVQPADCNVTVERLGDYLIEQGI